MARFSLRETTAHLLPVRASLAVIALLTLCSVWVYTSAQNAVPKYDASGQLIDSTIVEVNGKVGIGVTSPSGRLEVKSSGTNTSPLVARNSANTNPLFEVLEGTSGNANLYLYKQDGTKTASFEVATSYVTGNFGVGTTSPTGRFEVKSPGLGMSPLILRNSANANPLFEIAEGASGNANLYLYRVDGTLGVQLAPGPASVNYVLGSLGVGTTPTTKFHVAGDAKVTGNVTTDGNVTVGGNIGARYQDVAEWVDGDDSLPAGTVVTADPERSNRVHSSDKPYDTSVAGVISRQPGILLGQAGRGKVAVAQSGRVRVMVDATYGAIKPGDLLVTSPTPGFAMRSEAVTIGDVQIHRPGTILGKALEALREGRGEVLTLVTLQ
jgi:hypothetical protein